MFVSICRCFCACRNMHQYACVCMSICLNVRIYIYFVEMFAYCMKIIEAISQLCIGAVLNKLCEKSVFNMCVRLYPPVCAHLCALEHINMAV